MSRLLVLFWLNTYILLVLKLLGVSSNFLIEKARANENEALIDSLDKLSLEALPNRDIEELEIIQSK